MKKYFLLILVALITTGGCKKHSGKKVVVVYTSTDQVFSEPVLKAFEKKTGIEVKMVFDTEESKSTGLVNRLIAEKNSPQCDVFWSNDPLRVEILKQKGILQPYHSPSAEGIPEKFHDPQWYWTGFSGRIRVILVNTSLVKNNYPESVTELIDRKWYGQFSIANPLFGTTSFHIASLFVLWGDTRAKEFLEEMKKNGLKMASSNGEVAKWVAMGKVRWGFVDSDDAFSMIREGYSVKMIIPDQKGMGTLFMPNAVAMIKNCPHPETARKLIDFLLSEEAEKMLAYETCHQIPLHSGLTLPQGVPDISKIKTMDVSYPAVGKKMLEILPYLKKWVSH